MKAIPNNNEKSYTYLNNLVTFVKFFKTLNRKKGKLYTDFFSYYLIEMMTLIFSYFTRSIFLR